MKFRWEETEEVPNLWGWSCDSFPARAGSALNTLTKLGSTEQIEQSSSEPLRTSLNLVSVWNLLLYFFYTFSKEWNNPGGVVWASNLLSMSQWEIILPSSSDKNTCGQNIEGGKDYYIGSFLPFSYLSTNYFLHSNICLSYNTMSSHPPHHSAYWKLEESFRHKLHS